MSEFQSSKLRRAVPNKGGHYLRPQIPRQSKTEIFPGLNDITDVFEALPMDIIRYFTLIKEIDAKCVSVIPLLNSKIKKFKDIPNEAGLKEERSLKIKEISKLIKDLLPCLEEKMHVASIAADKVVNYIDRVNDDFELIFKNEIPENIKLGPYHHPAIINDTKIPDNKSVQTQRSESRREALAAKKAATNSEEPQSRKESTPNPTDSKKRKTTTTTNTTVEQEISRPNTPTTGAANPKKRTATKKRPAAPQSGLSTELKSEPDSISTVSNSGINTELNNLESIEKRNNNDEPLYCYCNQVSYGEMVGCDGDDCKREWFHLPCIGLATLPKGKWYCDECSSKLKKVRRI